MLPYNYPFTVYDKSFDTQLNIKTKNVHTKNNNIIEPNIFKLSHAAVG